MFAMAGLDLPYRNRKDASRASSVRGFSRRRHGASPTTALDQSLWMPMMSPDLWRRDFVGRGATPAPGISGFQSPESMPFFRATQPQTEQKYGGSDRRYGRSASDRGEYGLPFDQAADALCQALHFAIKHCQNLRESFNQEVVKSTITSWAPPKVVDALWIMKLDWDGIDSSEAERAPNAQRTPETVTFKDVVTNLFKAREALKTCARPRVEYFGEADSKPSPEVFRNTMKKLECIMSGVEEMMKSVRFDRSLMEHLVKDMTAATALLGEVEDLWLPARKQRAAEKARTKWEEENYVWAEYE
ncbi:hypothetical protein EJ03DRAFT_347684 [Teratosphaeria nubilosa]|uniref:Uncharacterized protein n=1 Tax=Teratosphaeria nubilosa TaxID=161662 RepID=A0A6G1LLH6_9PEZI|nr:hypothetical protein EJ03DRAFT_347684 [Teratosphaeria nubilosa]